MNPLLKFLDDLIQPGNRAFLVVFTLVLVVAALAAILVVVAYFRKERLDVSKKLGPIWIHLRGGADDPRLQKRGFRKVLYIQVCHLANRNRGATSFYDRTVERLQGPDAVVPVFDEAVYYTLKLFPEKRMLGIEQEASSGVVDPRLVIPWRDQVGFRSDLAQQANSLVNLETDGESDTMLSVSHFLNGMQDRNQDFSTYADEDMESLRIVVDFSSVPNAHDLVDMEGVSLLLHGRPVETEKLGYQRCGPSIYMAFCKDVKKGHLLRMRFSFKNW